MACVGQDLPYAGLQSDSGHLSGGAGSRHHVPMTEPADVAHLTLALLRKVDARTERMAEDLHDLKVRMSSKPR